MNDDITALRAAIAAGPTPGEWIACGPSFGSPDGMPTRLNEVVQADPEDSDNDCLPTICRDGDWDESFRAEQSANMGYIATAHPARITRVLDALEASQAECARLRADAERYRYLRNRGADEVLHVSGPAAGCWIDCEIGSEHPYPLTLLTGDDADAAIDAAMAETKETT